ncbi:MAG: hypothetical protein ACFE0I_20590 [Elainellaceae cyanobacterium]
MSDEQSREKMTAQRQHDAHTQETMSSRADEEIRAGDQSSTDEKAREDMTKQRQHEKHLRQTMEERAESE